jgi:small-conductance mechanosensitive channel
MPSTRLSTFLASVLASCTATLLIFATLTQAEEAVAPAEAKEAETSAPIPIGSVAIEAATLDNFLRSVDSELALPAALEKMIEELPEADAEVLAFTRHTESQLEGGYDRGDLDSFDAKWRSFAKNFDSWARVLKIRLTSLDEHRSQLIHRSGIWEATAARAREVSAPAELRGQISRVQSSLKTAAVALRKSRDQALGLQKRVIALRERVNAGLDALVGARSEVLSHITSRNDPPLWAIAQSDLNLAQQDFVAAFEDSRESIAGYAHRESKLFWMHAFLIALIVWASWMARIWMGRPPLHGTRPVPEALTHPTAAGLVLGLCAAMWIYSEAPPRLSWLLSLLALPFLFYVLRSLLPASLGRPLIGLVVLVLLDFGRRILMDFEILSRSLLALEAALALVGLILLRRPRHLANVPRPESLLWIRVLGGWLHLVLLGAAISFVGAVFGWTSLADLLLTDLVVGTFLGAVLFTAVLVIEAIAEASTYSGKLDRIRILRNHRSTFLHILTRIVRLIAFASWITWVLNNLSLQDGARDLVITILAAPIGYGSLQITLGGLAAFGITLWISWLLARLISVFLEDEIFTRVSLPRGVPFALSRMSHYSVLVLGFIAAIAALGFEIGNLALLVSALGVGIGFGMQNMVNNFISGLILLFERPIKVGDLVSLGELLGRVARIGIRSSTIRTFEGADVIVPNGDLISNQVTNWTLADTRRRVTLPVGVKYGTAAQRVIDLLEEVAHAHPEILEEPAPFAIFMAFGDSALEFELRAWTESADALTIVRSELAVGIQDALMAASIEVPFPQRDLHLKSVPEEPG